MQSSPVYLFDSKEKPELDLFSVPVIEATEKSVEGYGCMVDDPSQCDIEIVTYYVLGWSTSPQLATTGSASVERNQVLLWHMNYHPDGGQLFFPLDAKPFVVPVAMPGDDFAPEKVVALWCDGSRGLYIHPNIWHEGVFPATDEQRFLDRQGRVHARVSCDIGKEFGVYLSVPLQPN